MGLIDQSDDGRKPLWRKFVNQQKKAGVDIKDITDTVEVIRLSSSEEWILIEGQESVAMLNASSKAGKAFWETIEPFEGKLKGLKIVPATGKLGFDIEPHDNLVVDWEWDEGKLSCREEKSASSSFAQKLTLESMRVPVPLTDNASNNGNSSSKRGSKAATT